MLKYLLNSIAQYLLRTYIWHVFGAGIRGHREHELTVLIVAVMWSITQKLKADYSCCKTIWPQGWFAANYLPVGDRR